MFKDTGNNQRFCATCGEVKEPEVTLRDQFAMAALQGILAGGYSVKAMSFLKEDLVKDVYRIADEMIKQRK